ncbi:unnamed protein product [Pseudo-nitzschia multistriata]|uniref:Uncharacterized protein n=1 Tax=Pseudo-nitzschia multistriata TaxID=183589 RepID=A0A448ZDN7_9STRA|nr:unnamed protein product [Pseudo-nitzschia multistriata]
MIDTSSTTSTAVTVTMKKAESKTISTKMESSPLPKKSVRFLTNSLVYRTEHINDYTKGEIERSWYSQEEMSSIVSDCMDTLTAVKNNDPSNSSGRCLRGLEYHLPEGQKKRRANKFGAIDLVLDEQTIQWECEEEDAHAIRTLYLTYSVPCQAEANRIGLDDEREARFVYRESDKNNDNCLLELSATRPSLLALKQASQHKSFKCISNELASQCSPVGRAA